MPCSMHAGITSICIFSSFAHKHPANLSVIGGALLLESIIWCTRIVRCPEFGGCPLFESSKCIEFVGIAVGVSTVVRYTVDVRYWECPLTEAPLYIHVYTYIYVGLSATTGNDNLFEPVTDLKLNQPGEEVIEFQLGQMKQREQPA